MKRLLLPFLVALLVLQPWSGAVGADPGRALWSLHYLAGPVLTQGFHPTEVAYPAGGWWFFEGGLESLLLAPVSAVSPVLSWNVLWILRILAATVGMAKLLERRGLSPAWAFLPALWPTTWILAEQGALEAGAILYLPLVLWQLEERRDSLLLGALIGSSPGLMVGTILGMAQAPSWRTVRRATIVAASFLLLRLACMLPQSTLLPHTRARLLTLEGPGDLGAGTLDGAFWGWGSPLILAVILGIFRKERRQGTLLVLAGLLLALGPTLQWGDAPLMLAGKAVPLPLMFVQRLPPVSAASHLVGFGLLCGVGTALVLASALSRNRMLERGMLVGSAVLLTAQGWWGRPSHTPVEGDDAEEASFLWPLPRSAGEALMIPALGGGPVPVGPESLLSPAMEAILSQPVWQLPAFQEQLKKEGFKTLKIRDCQATWDQAPDLCWLFGSTEVPVDGPIWPSVDLQKHSYKSQATVPVLPEIAPASSDWTSIENGLAGLFDRDLGKLALTEVWMYRSSDGKNWGNPSWVAHSLTSLGLDILPDGIVILTGMVSLGPQLGPKFPPFHSSAVVTVTSPDLQHWGARRWWLADRLSLVDSEVRWENGKPVLSSWARTGPLGVDPVKLTGAHPVVRAPLGDDGLFHGETPHLFVQGLADPHVVGDLLYATQFILGRLPEVQIYRLSTGEKLGSLPGLTVPSVSRDDGSWRLYAHGPGVSGPLALVTAESPDGLHWSPPQPVPGFENISRCESPVSMKRGAEYLLFCSARLGEQVEEAPPER